MPLRAACVKREKKEETRTAAIEKLRPDRSEHFLGIAGGVCSRETHNRRSEKSDGRNHGGFHGARGPGRV